MSTFLAVGWLDRLSSWLGHVGSAVWCQATLPETNSKFAPENWRKKLPPQKKLKEIFDLIVLIPVNPLIFRCLCTYSLKWLGFLKKWLRFLRGDVGPMLGGIFPPRWVPSVPVLNGRAANGWCLDKLLIHTCRCFWHGERHKPPWESWPALFQALFLMPRCSMYGIFTYICHILPLKNNQM